MSSTRLLNAAEEPILFSFSATFNQFDRDFPTDDACLEAIKEQRLPGGESECRKCLKSCNHYRVHGRTAYAYETCGNHISTPGWTIFEKSNTAMESNRSHSRTGIYTGFNERLLGIHRVSHRGVVTILCGLAWLSSVPWCHAVTSSQRWVDSLSNFVTISRNLSMSFRNQRAISRAFETTI